MNNFTYEEIEIGLKEQFKVLITEEMEDAFRTITGDVNPLHKDDVYASEVGSGRFIRHVTFGMLTASFYSTLAGVYIPGKYSLIHSIDTKFTHPVYIGDELQITGEVVDKQDDLKLIQIKARIYNQNNKCVSKSEMKVLLLK